VSQAYLPLVTVRQAVLDELHRDFPVAEAKFFLSASDWNPFIREAYAGMEVAVGIEGSGEQVAAVLLLADERDLSVTVVI
jgi:hypothetical protein